MASPALIAAIATELVKTFATMATTDTLLKPAELVDALTKMDKDRLLGTLINTATKVSPALVTDVLQGIKKFQKSTDSLVPDGILGGKTLRAFLSRPFACIDPDRSKLPTSTSTVTQSKVKENPIRIFIDGELPSVTGLSKDRVFLNFRQALDFWAQVCNIVIKIESNNKKNANVIVSTEKLGQGPTVLGMGQIGPPGNRQLTLQYEALHTFDLDTFLTTTAHEFGHVLGIKHEDVGGKGQLMFGFKQSGIAEPQDEDILAAQRLYGAPLV